MADSKTTLSPSVERIQNLYREGDGVDTIAKDLGISVVTVWNALNRGKMDSYYS